MSVLAIVVIVLLVLVLSAAVWHSDKDWLKHVFKMYVQVTKAVFKKGVWVEAAGEFKLLFKRLRNVFKQHSTPFKNLTVILCWLVLTPVTPVLIALRSLVRVVFNK